MNGSSTAFPLDHLAHLPRGVRLRITDSHDVTGGNDDGFTSTYSYLYRTDEGWVLFDHKGPGCILLIRTIGFVTTLKVFLDDEPTPRIVVPFAELYSGRHPDFPAHLVCDEEKGHGSAWSFVPIPFRTRCVIVAPEKLESYHFFNIWAYVYDAPEIGEEPPPEMLAPALWEHPERRPPQTPDTRVLRGTCAVAGHDRVTLAQAEGGGVVRWLRLRLPKGEKRPEVLERLFLRAWWDDRPLPDVDAPVGLFFAVGFPDERALAEVTEYTLTFGEHTTRIPLGRTAPRAIPVGECDDGTLYCHFPMPFWAGAHVELANFSPTPVEGIEWEVGLSERAFPSDCGYFCARYRHEDGTLPHRDYTVSALRGRGRYVGCVMRMSSRTFDRSVGVLQRLFLEGDARFYMDDAHAFLCGSTGTEEYFNWGWYDGAVKDAPFAFPMHGYVEHMRTSQDHSTMYRFHLTDSIPYYRSFRFDIEHGPEGEVPSDYRSVAFHYHRDDPVLVLTDVLDVGDPENEREHGHHVRGVEWEGRRTLTYEGNGQVCARKMRESPGESWEELAGVADDGHAWDGTCEFIVSVRPDNAGVLLRRRYDGEWPPGEVPEGEKVRIVGAQEVQVYVDGEAAGRWYLPPRIARRAWMEDEYMLPARLTEGKTQLRLRFVHRGDAPWNAFRYWVFSMLA